MGRPRHPDPLKHCAHCTQVLARKRQHNGDLESLLHFGRRKFCGRVCMSAAFDARPSKPWIGWVTAHYHARRAIPPGPCTMCPNPHGRDVHHRDSNHRNNDPSNLVRVCRSCHMKMHRPAKKCRVCGGKVKGLGYCNRHYIQFKDGRLIPVAAP